MRKAVWCFLIATGLLVGLSTNSSAQCTTINSGNLTYQSGYLVGQPLAPGFNPYGYNYQAGKFQGSYFNAYAASANLPPYDGDDAAYLAANPGAATHWAWPYRHDDVSMKWNRDWLSNSDCNSDGKLDRASDYTGTYKGTGAWENNQMSGTCTVNGKTKTWTYYTAIVAVPLDAYLDDGVYYTADGRKIGTAIWGDFAIVLEVSNDPCAGQHGVLSKGHPGMGLW